MVALSDIPNPPHGWIKLRPDDIREKEDMDKFEEVLEELRDLHERKAKDYGKDEDPLANVKGSEQWGVPAWQGAMIRATDKVVRLQSYARKGELANEGVEDSLMDLAVYAMIALILFRESEESDD